MRNQTVVVKDKMQNSYIYVLSEPIGKKFDTSFNPDLTPKQMLALGVFGGHYMTDTQKEFPKDWFTRAKMNSEKHDDSLNYFEEHASQPLSVWRKKGWINEDHDPRGWFQWYCRYYMGRRLPEEDLKQINRWRSYRRHAAQVYKNCKPRDMFCRPKQRQSLLHWAYDSREI
ncbi:MAG: hypothetical protein ACI88L_000595 [Candidatus Paceibacteria bacterium]|jgi:hypothetical protein